MKNPPDILERTFNFVSRIIKLCAHLDVRPGVGRVMMPQILRSVTSVLSNVEEAQAAQSKADFVSKMSMALREARETHLRLHLVLEARVVRENRLQSLISEADGLKRFIGAIIFTTKRGGSRS